MNRKTWIGFLLIAGLSLGVWFYAAYPQLAFVDLSVDRPAALDLAKKYLKNELSVDPAGYRRAVVFSTATSSDVYLQKTLGFSGELDFLKKNNYELFFWKVRFFKEQQKEEFSVLLSAATGEAINCFHTIEDSATRQDEGKDRAHNRAQKFLEKNFKTDLNKNYLPHADFSKKFDNRVDYAFIWEKKGVFVPWDKDPSQGGAKLLTSASVSGKDILSFNKTSLLIPDQFNRDLEKRRAVGNNLWILFRYLFLGLLITAVYLVALRRNSLVLHNTKNFAIGLTVSIFVLSLLSRLNHFQGILFNYPTTISFGSYLWQDISNSLLDAFITSLGILLPCLAAESLHHEMFPDKKEGRFIHYLNSTFFSQKVSRLIFLGYLAAVIMFGIQSAAFSFGQKYLGVWTEHTWMASLSGNYLPFLAALTIGWVASVSEEIFFRIFGISLGKKIFKNTFVAVLVSSLIWGYGHSTYPIYPMWFRGLEVTALGIFLSFVYLRYGIIPVLVAHFLFDVFWYGAAYLFGKTTPYYFYSTLAVLLLPFFWAGLAYFLNRRDTEQPLRWQLNRHQIYNLQILKEFMRHGGLNLQPGAAREEIISHGWDPAVVDTALEDLKNEENRSS